VVLELKLLCVPVYACRGDYFEFVIILNEIDTSGPVVVQFIRLWFNPSFLRSGAVCW